MNKEGISGFYYVPCNTKVMGESNFLQNVHLFGICIFYPAWMIDHALRGPEYLYLPFVRLKKASDGEIRTAEKGKGVSP